jgi:hypothetical protein
MSRELEQRLEHALRQVESSATAEEQAREAALGALPGAGGGRGRYRVALVAAAVAVALAVTAGATLAASRTARQAVGLASGDHTRNRPGLRAGPLPPGSAGFAVYGGGKLWLASPGLRLGGARYSAAELSPGALNVVLGSGRDLVVRRLSDGGIAWRHPAGGRVVAAAWAPIGTEIAYVVRARTSYQLRLIEGDGDHDRLLVAHVAPVAPSWRSDSLAIAYANRHEQIAVDDFANGRTEVVKRPPDCPLITTWDLAFAPRGGVLAASIGDGNVLVADPRNGWAACAGAAMRVLGPLPPAQIAWDSDRILLAVDDQFLDRMAVTGRSLSLQHEVAAPAGIDGLTVSPDAREIAFGLRRATHVEIVAARVPRPTDARLKVVRLLRNVPPSPEVMNGFYRLIWR